jgi:hypothetical protein
LDFDQIRQIFGSAFLPGFEGFEKLKVGTGRRDLYIEILTVVRRWLI